MNEVTKLIPAEAQAIALSPKGQVMLKNVGEAAAFASLMAASEMLPPRVTVPSAVVAIVAGMSLGLSPFESVQSIAVIGGRPSIYGDGLKALVLGSGALESEKVEWFTNKEGKRRAVRVILKRKGNEEPIVGEFSEALARQAGLWEKRGPNGQPSPWVLYPERMLLARARANAYKDGFADILKGIRSAEEEQDIILTEEPSEMVSVAPAPPVAKLPKPRGRRRASAAEIIEADVEVVDTPDSALSPVVGAKAPANNNKALEEVADNGDFLQ